MSLVYHPALTSPIRVPECIELPAPRRYRAVDIQRAVCQHFGIERDDLIGKGQSLSLAHRRQLAMHIVRKFTKLSFGQIGVAFGGRDHSTVIHAVSVVASRLSEDDDLAADHDAILEALGEC